MFKLLLPTILFTLGIQAHASLPQKGKYFDRAIFVLFENTDYEDALNQPFFKQLATRGAFFSQFKAVTHPSQGNYVALTSGSIHGVSGDGKYDLQVENIVDLLESKGLTWKVYAEDYPGNCFTGATSGGKGGYVRKHNPFISYVNIQSNPSRCSNIVEASEFDQDALQGLLPNYVFYIPNNKNNGHDTDVSYAGKWYQKKFSSYFSDSKFMHNTIVISTFDESDNYLGKNQIYASIIGPSVKASIYSEELNLYSLLNLIELNWDLGSLGKEDTTAQPIPFIWK